MTALFRPHRIAGAALYAPDYGAVGVTANSAITMGTFVAAGTASVGVTANSSLTMGEFTSSSSGSTDVNANASVSMGAFTSMATAAVTGTAIDPGEPVTVDEAKDAARFYGDELDAFIAGAISAARAEAEQITGRVYRRRVFSFKLPGWPVPGHRLAVYEPDLCEISYWGASGWQQLSASAFEFEGIGSGAEIAPALGGSWPALATKALGARVKVDFTAGPMDRTEVDDAVKLYIKAQVAAWLNNPEALVAGDLKASPLLTGLLDAERLWC